MSCLGDLYIGAFYNCVVCKISSSTGIISTFAGGAGCGMFIGEGVVATSAWLYYPSGVALDSVGMHAF